MGLGLGCSESLVDHAGETALEGANGLAGGVALGATPLVVRPAGTGETQLRDRDAVQGGVELPVATA